MKTVSIRFWDRSDWDSAVEDLDYYGVTFSSDAEELSVELLRTEYDDYEDVIDDVVEEYNGELAKT